MLDLTEARVEIRAASHLEAWTGALPGGRNQGGQRGEKGRATYNWPQDGKFRECFVNTDSQSNNLD